MESEYNLIAAAIVSTLAIIIGVIIFCLALNVLLVIITAPFVILYHIIKFLFGWMV